MHGLSLRPGGWAGHHLAAKPYMSLAPHVARSELVALFFSKRIGRLGLDAALIAYRQPAYQP